MMTAELKLRATKTRYGTHRGRSQQSSAVEAGGNSASCVQTAHRRPAAGHGEQWSVAPVLAPVFDEGGDAVDAVDELAVGQREKQREDAREMQDEEDAHRGVVAQR
jgi:hypothetical protein